MNESNKPTSEETQITPSVDISVEVFGRTDVGLVREHNEDNFLVADLTEGNRSIRPEVRNHQVGRKGSVFAVCDGMGGAAAGEVASQIAVDTIYDMMEKGDCASSDEDLARKLEKAVCEAGRRIFTAAKINRSQRGMGTTVTAAALIGPRLLVGQVGDSRAYILRGRQFIQVTKDQSLVQQLIDAKQMTEEEARTFDKNNIILQALGTAEEVHVDVTSVMLKKGDRLIMCSDGLSGVVDNDTICDVVSESLNPMEACRILTEKACLGGGHDNITVIVAIFSGDSLDVPPSCSETDPDLVYNRFTFSRSSETTARKMRPSSPSSPEKMEPAGEATQSVEVLEALLDEESEPIPNLLSRRLPIPLVAAAILMISIVIIAMVVSQGSKDTSIQTSIPAIVPTPPLPLKPTGSDSRPTNAAAPQVEDTIPQLAPTPVEAITKSQEQDDNLSSKPENSSNKGELSTGNSGDIDNPAAPAKEKKTGNGAEDNKNHSSKKDHNSYETEEDTASLEQGGQKGGKKTEPENVPIAPKPIDDNPFVKE